MDPQALALNFPPELLCKIFSHLIIDPPKGVPSTRLHSTLPSCARVCRAWLDPARVALFTRPFGSIYDCRSRSVRPEDGDGDGDADGEEDCESDPRKCRLFKALKGKRYLARLVRSLVIDGLHRDRVSNVFRGHLDYVFEHCDKLDEVSMIGKCTSRLFSAHQSANSSYGTDTARMAPGFRAYNGTDTISLPPNITSLRFIAPGWAPLNRPEFRIFLDFLKTLPQLRHLYLYNFDAFRNVDPKNGKPPYKLTTLEIEHCNIDYVGIRSLLGQTSAGSLETITFGDFRVPLEVLRLRGIIRGLGEDVESFRLCGVKDPLGIDDIPLDLLPETIPGLRTFSIERFKQRTTEYTVATPLPEREPGPHALSPVALTGLSNLVVQRRLRLLPPRREDGAGADWEAGRPTDHADLVPSHRRTRLTYHEQS